MARKQADDGRVEVFVPRGRKNEEPNVLIGINGVNYLLPKGKTSVVPKCVAEEYRRSIAAQVKYDETVDDLLAQSQAPLTR